MPRLAAIVVIFLIFPGLHARSQSLDTLVNPVVDTLRSKINLSRFDSVGLEKRQKLDSVQSSVATSFNSLKESYDSVSGAADKSITKYRQKIDSLTTLKLPTEKLTAKADSVLNWKNTKLGGIKGKADALRTKTIEKINMIELPPELKGDAQQLTSAVQKLDVSLPKAQLPDLSLKNPISIPGVNNPLGGKGIPGVPDLKTGLPNTDIGKVTQGKELPGLSNLGEVGEKVDEVTKVIPKNIDDVPKTLEQQVTKIDQVGAVSNEMGKIDQLKPEGMPGMPAQDPEAMKKQMLEQAKEVAVDHFAGKEKQLQEAMEKVAKYKQKYSSVQSLADLPKRKPNEMHGRPFIERLVPGIALQVFKKQQELMVDFNPYVGYRLSGRLTAGLGWNQRVVYNTRAHSFHSESSIYGVRMYSEFKAIKGFSGRIEGEWMNTYVPPAFSSRPNEPPYKQWIFTTMIGIKKEYRFIKNVKGTFMILYNLYDPHHRSPYPDKLNTRFGFEFPLKKKVKTKKAE